MKHTKEQLDKMRDHEVNLAVAKKLGLDTEVGNMRYKGGAIIGEFVFTYHTPSLQVRFEPCSNWNDVMPIVIAQGIGIAQMANGNTRVYHYTPFIGKNGNRSGFLNNDNPNTTRAICEVFLMMDKYEGKESPFSLTIHQPYRCGSNLAQNGMIPCQLL